METGNKFLNSYVELAIATIQEQVVQGLQLKAQSKVASDLLSEKDQYIEQLLKENEQLKESKSLSESNSTNAKYWEDSYHALQNKISHMDTLTRQVADMKNEIIRRNETITSLEKKIQEQTASYEQQISDLKKKQKSKEVKEIVITKVDLNNKVNDGNKDEKVVVVDEKKKLPTDDF